MPTTTTSEEALIGASTIDLSGAWKIILLRSIFTILFGGIALLWPQLSLIALVFTYAFYALADGILSLFAAVRAGGWKLRWWLILGGIAGIVAGAIAVAMPNLTAVVFMIFLGVAAIIRGVTDIVGAFQLRRYCRQAWPLVPAGMMSILFGVLLIVMPGIAALVITTVLGAWAIILGTIGIGLAFKVRKYKLAN